MIPKREEMENAQRQKQGEDVQRKLAGSMVAICGLGGLGSNVAISLARAGVGRLILIDFDKVDITNLHRQQYKASQVGQYKTEALRKNLRDINPYVEIFVHTVKLTEDNVIPLVRHADVICEAFDNPDSKALLVNTVLEKLPNKYLVAASGMAGFGSANEIQTRKVSDRFFLCGDEKSDVNDGIGLISSRVMLCAAHEAHAIIRILTGQTEA